MRRLRFAVSEHLADQVVSAFTEATDSGLGLLSSRQLRARKRRIDPRASEEFL